MITLNIIEANFSEINNSLIIKFSEDIVSNGLESSDIILRVK